MPTTKSSARALALVAFASACNARDAGDGFAPYQGVAPGTIGSGPQAPDDGDDDDDDGDGDDDGESSQGGPAPGGGGTSSPTPDDDDEPSPTGDTGMPGSGDPVLDACLEIAVDACQTCACTDCLQPLYACQQDAGCVAMRECAQASGCAGADCLEPCGDVIDMHGGVFGNAAALAVALSDCLEGACPSCFS